MGNGTRREGRANSPKHDTPAIREKVYKTIHSVKGAIYWLTLLFRTGNTVINADAKTSR